MPKDMRVNCTGGGTFYGRYFACDKRHGMVDILHAIPFSCDTFYYTLAERLGIEKIAYWAHKVGIGQKTGIDLPGEVSGTMPSEEWKMKTFHEKWYAGRSHLRRHRARRSHGYAHPVGAGDRRHCFRWRPQAAPRGRTRRTARRVSPGLYESFPG